MIFLVDAIFENRVAQVTYMKNMSRKSEIQKVAFFWTKSGDVSMINVQMGKCTF
jgi:hypothetical protein